MKTGLYFGSFNPIHIGHLIIANHVLNTTACQKIWFVVSPQNPLKPNKSLLNEYHRLHLVRLATEDNKDFKVSDVEFLLPRPSYTIDTLTYLQEKYPLHEFSVIMGSDSFLNLGKWKNPDKILKHHHLIVYNRPGFQPELPASGRITLLQDAPLLDISATRIRTLIKERKSIRYLVPDPVLNEIELGNYYRD